MVFGRKKASGGDGEGRSDEAAGEPRAVEVVEAADAAPSDAQVDFMRGLDALAHVLRTLGGHALDLENHPADETREQFEAWARHVLLGTPLSEEQKAAGPSTARDWAGLESYVTGFRSTEVDEIQQNVGELRDVVWVFIQCFTKALASDNQVDERTIKQLASLKESVDTDDIVRLRNQAVAAVQLVESAIETRRGRYENQVAQLSEQLDRMAGDLVRAKRDGAIDALTGAYNRASLDEHIRAMTQLGGLTSTPPMVFMIDIDHFKWINDSHGHAVGDEILKRVTAKMKSEFRRSSDLLSRFGGDEFTLVVQNAGTGSPKEIGDRILFAVRDASYEHNGEVLRVSASVGGAIIEAGESSSAWMRRADDALYQAKNRGRDCCVIAGDE